MSYCFPVALEPESLKAKFARWQRLSKLDDGKPAKILCGWTKMGGKKSPGPKNLWLWSARFKYLHRFLGGVLLAVRFRFVFLARAIS